MLLFGHIGITASVVKAYDILVIRIKQGVGSEYASNYIINNNKANGKKNKLPDYLLNWIKNKGGTTDYRIVLLGSLLPDIIDKPLWLFAISDIFSVGRGYAHTLLFNLVLLITGLIILRYGKSWLLTISICSFIHIILDQIWNLPVVLFWPLLGPLPESETASWLMNIIQAIFLNPGVYISEIIGLVLILLWSYRLVMRKMVIKFIRFGAIK